MKTLLFAVGIVFMTGTFTSCKKCIECKAEDGPGGVNQSKEEFCGNKAQRDAYEANWISTYTAAGYNDVKCD